MLILRSRLISEFGECGTDQRANHTAAAVRIIVAGLIEHNNEQAVLLEDRVLDQRVDLVFEPIVGGAEATIVGIIAAVRCNKGVVGRVPGREILGQLAKGTRF